MELVRATDDPSALWRPADLIPDLPHEGDVRQWLEDSGSLTRRLRRLGGKDFCLDVVGETWEPAREVFLPGLASFGDQ